MVTQTRASGTARQARKGRGWALVATTLGFAVVQLDVSVVNVAVRAIGSDLGGRLASLQWVVDAYTVVFAALLLSAGALGDRLGAKRVFVAGFVIFVIGSSACGAAPSLSFLIAARAAQGVGAAALVPCSLTLLRHEYAEERERARAVGLWLAGSAVALSAGPLVGGALIAVLDWRAIFLINLPLGAAAIVLTLRYAAETTRSAERRLDLAGEATGVVALGTLAAAMVSGGQRGFGDPLVAAAFVLAATAAGAFVVIERRHRDPMLPASLFRSRAFTLAVVLGLLVNVAFYGLIFVLSLYFQTTLGYSALRAGLAFLPSTVAVFVANVASSRISARLGLRAMVTVAIGLVIIALVGLLPAGHTTSYVTIAGQLTVLGFGLGLAVPAITTATLSSVEAERSGVASGTLNTARQTGSVVGVALFGAFAASGLVHGLHLSVAVSIALGVVALVLASGLRESVEAAG